MRAALIAAAISLSACTTSMAEMFQPNGPGLDVSGEIDSDTPDLLEDALDRSPGIKTLRLLAVPGSSDDETSLQVLMPLIREEGLTTIVPAKGVVASGGTDMALMGVRRIIEPGACIGVHSWAWDGGSGADLPHDDPEHVLFLEFYTAIGMSEAFYWFTLAAAGPDDMHWMSEDEINRFALSMIPVTGSPAETPEQRAARCERRLP
jgi:hypothetical protein